MDNHPSPELTPSSRWLPERNPLGTGGFGQVFLYVNSSMGEKIAVKQCKHEMNDKMRRRWELEVNMMNNLDHRNIIKALEVPAEIQRANNTGFALLGMEYCSGGDLRKVLSRPENHCGVEESTVCSVAYQLACGIEYLHSMRIFHRDIKPENIVLQPGVDGGVVYKIIDLGYAKQLDDGASNAESFVGTQQYLAPELFTSKGHSNTVDYWTFGTVIFELITGERPFLPQAQPYPWMAEVQKKTDDDIYATEVNGVVHFGKSIPKPNKLCTVMDKEFQSWLRLMLTWDKTKRGGRSSLAKLNETPKALTDLYCFLSRRVVHILDFVHRKSLSYCVGGAGDDAAAPMTVARLKILVARDTGIPVDEQVLLTGVNWDPSLTVPAFDEPAAALAAKCQPAVPRGRDDNAPKFLHRSCRPEDDVIYLFQTPDESGFPYVVGDVDDEDDDDDLRLTFRSNLHIPFAVRNMVDNPRAILRPADQKRAIYSTYCYCRSLIAEHESYWGVFRALLIKIVKEFTGINRCKAELRFSSERLVINREFFVKSLSTDLEALTRLKASASCNLLAVDGCLRDWNREIAEADEYTDLGARTTALEKRVELLGSKIIKIQQDPVSRQQRPDYIRLMETQRETALELIASWRKAMRDPHLEFPDNADVVAVVCRVNELDARLTPVRDAVGRLMRCFVDMRSLLPEMKLLRAETTESSDRLEAKQRLRQGKIWSIVEEARRANGNLGLGLTIGGGGGGGVAGGGVAESGTASLARSVSGSGAALDEEMEEAEEVSSRADEVLDSLQSALTNAHVSDVATGSEEWESLFV